MFQGSQVVRVSLNKVPVGNGGGIGAVSTDVEHLATGLSVGIIKERHHHNIKQIRKKDNHAGTRGFRKTQVGSNEKEFCGDGLESHKDRRSQWVLRVLL